MRGLFIVAIGLARTAGALSYNAPLSAVSRVSSPSMMAKSKALPFLEQPAHLDGSMAGDVGFDPLGLGSAYNMKWMREAELKHGRMCQLAWLGYVAVDLGIKFPGEKYAALSSFTAHEGTATPTAIAPAPLPAGGRLSGTAHHSTNRQSAPCSPPIES